MIVALAPGHRLQFEVAQGGFVLLYPEGMVQLSDTAADLLGRCTSPVEVATLIDGLKAEYAAEAGPAIGDDVRDFVEEACGRGWLTVR